MEFIDCTQTYKLYRVLPMYKLLKQSLDEISDEISDDIKLKCLSTLECIYHRRVRNAKNNVVFKYDVDHFKKSGDFVIYAGNMYTNTFNGFVKIVVYRPTVRRGLEIVSFPTPYSALQAKKVVEVRPPKEKTRRTDKFGSDPSDNCMALGGNVSKHEVWLAPMPYNMKLAKSKDRFEARIIAEIHSNISKPKIIKEKYRRQATVYPVEIIRENERKVLDHKRMRIDELYKREYKVKMLPRDLRIVDLAKYVVSLYKKKIY